jgi:hypothetical protein
MLQLQDLKLCVFPEEDHRLDYLLRRVSIALE